MRIRASWHFVEAFSLALAAYLSVTGANGMREDELLCEEALARLEDCCPPEDLANVSCTYDSGCMSESTYPQIGPKDARCIRDRTCEDLFARGLCERLGNGHGIGEPYPDLQVCL